MVKGFIIYKNGKIPFVIDKYRMELFTDDKILNDFMQEHNKKRNYILSGVYFSLGTEPRKITILVEHSLGSTCYQLYGASRKDRVQSRAFHKSCRQHGEVGKPVQWTS